MLRAREANAEDDAIIPARTIAETICFFIENLPSFQSVVG
jgi:hypothetical protein